MEIEVKIVNELAKKFEMPKYHTPLSAGIDLIAAIEAPIILKPNECFMIGTGLAFFIKSQGHCGLVLPRSGLGHKNGIILGNCVGLIDPDYQGELKISAWNRSDVPFVIEPGLRLAQLLIVPFIQASILQVQDFSTSTQRGTGGFGSTGISVNKECETSTS